MLDDKIWRDVYIDNIDNVTKYDQLEFPIKFAIDNNGSFIDLR